MTLESLLKDASEYLEKNHVEDPSREAGLLLSWALNTDLSRIYSHPELCPGNEAVEAFRSAVERRAKHEPFAYITGESEFMSLSFKVNPHVLIPRPDTELLVEAALSSMHEDSSAFFAQSVFKLPEKKLYRVLDIGTGSGCLAVSLAKYSASVAADAVDISKEALETAGINAQRHKVAERISFIHADFLSMEYFPIQYDIVLSNPPYIPSDDIPGLMPSVRDYEPHRALTDGEDGLSFYKALAEKAGLLLNDNGIMAMECGFDQADRIRDLFVKRGMEALLLKDLAGIHRVVMTRKQPKV